MKPLEGSEDLYARWEGAVAFRLFADQEQPTLTVAEQIAARVGDRILDGTLAPGERIVEQEMADEFGVSRGPVRDALWILQRENLVTLLARRGAVVTTLSADEVREIFEIRAGLHELVARRTIARRDPELLALMRAGVARLQRLAELDDDGGRYAETTYRLSILAARQCGNRRLYRTIAALSLQTLRYSKLGLASRERRQRSVRLWRDGLAALERGDLARYLEITRARIEESGAEAVERVAPEPPTPQSSTAPPSRPGLRPGARRRAPGAPPGPAPRGDSLR
ncbi:MAG: GntR family transcriptional regulator [Kofleriaceae bacterium]